MIFDIQTFRWDEGGNSMAIFQKTFALTLFALASIGATTPAPTAILTVQKGYDKGAGFGTGTAQTYDIADANQCKPRKRIAYMSLITGAVKSKSVPAGKTIYLTAFTNVYSPAGLSSTGYGFYADVNRARCENRASFTPQPGENYTILQKAEIGKACSMTVIAQSSNAPPADLVELEKLGC
jgi:hypothetical protein